MTWLAHARFIGHCMRDVVYVVLVGIPTSWPRILSWTTDILLFYLALGLHALISNDNFCHARFVLKFVIVCVAHGSCVFNFDNL